MNWKAFVLILAGVMAAAHAATLAPMTTAMEDCDDDVNANCWDRPGSDCFGIYEPWSRVHCPLRCGFCPGKLPPCEDALNYCDRFENNTCSDPDYAVWARNNCRKSCNLCAVPTRPTGTTPVMGGTTATGGNGQGNTIIPTSSGQANEIPGTVAKGTQISIIIEAPGSQNRTDVCLYHGNEYKQNDRWNDGCDYECACMQPSINRVVCTEKCTRWNLTDQLKGCKLVKEPGECCDRLECQEP